MLVSDRWSEIAVLVVQVSFCEEKIERVGSIGTYTVVAASEKD